MKFVNELWTHCNAMETTKLNPVDVVMCSCEKYIIS